MTVKFKNETEMFISDEIAQNLADNIINGGDGWQVFFCEHDNPILILNLNEVTCIIDETKLP